MRSSPSLAHAQPQLEVPSSEARSKEQRLQSADHADDGSEDSFLASFSQGRAQALAMQVQDFERGLRGCQWCACKVRAPFTRLASPPRRETRTRCGRSTVSGTSAVARLQKKEKNTEEKKTNNVISNNTILIRLKRRATGASAAHRAGSDGRARGGSALRAAKCLSHADAVCCLEFRRRPTMRSVLALRDGRQVRLEASQICRTLC